MRCPFCREEIQANARKCKYCGEFVDGALIAYDTTDAHLVGLSPYYQAEFRMIKESGEKYKGVWNWAAFLFGAFWGFSKGLWVPATLCIVGSLLSYGIVGIAFWFIFGARGNYMYYCKIVKRQNIAV